MTYSYKTIAIVIIGIATIMVLGERSTIEIPIPFCSDCQADIPVSLCVWAHATQRLCPGQSATANITLKLSQDLMNNLTLANFKVMVHGQKFSHGSLVSGRFHNGDKLIDRWTIGISFKGNTMTYDLLNDKIEFTDAFPCRLEIDISGNKFISNYFQWFEVDNLYCMPSTPTCTCRTDMGTKDTPELHVGFVSLVNQLNNMSSAMSTFTTTLKDIRKQNDNLQQLLLNQLAMETNSSDRPKEIIPKSLTDQLDTLNKIGMAFLALLSILVLQSPAALKMFQLMSKLPRYFRGYRLSENRSARNNGPPLSQEVSAPEADIGHGGSQMSVLIPPEAREDEPQDHEDTSV